MFLRKGVLKICSKFTGEHPCRSATLGVLRNFEKFTGKQGQPTINKPCYSSSFIIVAKIFYSNSIAFNIVTKGGSRTAGTSKMERFMIIVNSWNLECCSSPTSSSGYRGYLIQSDNMKTLQETEAATRVVLCKKVFLEMTQNSQENTCARISFSIKLQAQAFSCEFCENSKSTFFTEHLWMTASKK